MKRIFKYLSLTKKEAILAPLFKMLEVIFELIVPLIVSSIIDDGLKNPNGTDFTYVILMCLLLLVLGILGLISAVVAQYFAAVSSSKLQTRMRMDLLKKINSLEYQELDEVGTASLINKMGNDVNQVTNGVNMTLRLLLRSPIVVIGAVFVAFFFSFNIGITFLIVVPILFILIFLIMVFTIPLFKKTQEKNDVLVRLTRENLLGVRVLRAFNKQEKEISNYHKNNDNLTKYQLFAGKISNLINPLTLAFINIFIIILIYLGAFDVNVGELESGDVLGIYNLAGQILIEMVKFATLLVTLSKSLASDKRIESIFALESHLQYSSEIDSHESPYLFEFNDVCMSYNGKENALENISFKVKEGEMIGIIGGTGSGKTTLVNLLGHYYDISKGKIYYKGKNLINYKPSEIRKDISYVPQKASLFKGTIRDNLKMSNLSIDDETILKALRIAQGEDFVKAKEGSLDYKVEQEGRNFSGGQKQRLTIARALLRDSPILVLDDSSSALDYKTESNLRKALQELKNKTIFIVSQRASSLLTCSTILVLDKGKIVGRGNHEQLLKSCPVYQEIYSSQFHEEAKHE